MYVFIDRLASNINVLVNRFPGCDFRHLYEEVWKVIENYR